MKILDDQLTSDEKEAEISDKEGLLEAPYALVQPKSAIFHEKFRRFGGTVKIKTRHKEDEALCPAQPSNPSTAVNRGWIAGKLFQSGKNQNSKSTAATGHLRNKLLSTVRFDRIEDKQNMSRGLNVEELRFRTSMIEKENRQRLAWFLKHQSHLIEQQEEKLSVVKPKKFTIKREIPDVGKAKIDTTDVMRPVDEDVRQLMSSGRKKYLEKRYELPPNRKFYFKESKNWEYGWNAEEAGGVSDYQSSKEVSHGRVAVIQESFFRPGGVERDPSRYRNPEEVSLPLPLQ